jgi:Ricin-type beta-trefoil lectin domain
MRYNSDKYTITNPYGKCMDAGDINNPSNRWLRYHTCHGGNNQKWFQANDGRIWSHQRDNANQVMCIEYTGTGNGNSVNVNPCNGNQSQKFYFDIGIIRQEVPSNIKYMMMRSLQNVRPIRLR